MDFSGLTAAMEAVSKNIKMAKRTAIEKNPVFKFFMLSELRIKLKCISYL
jgi:hypothetical protein